MAATYLLCVSCVQWKVSCVHWIAMSRIFCLATLLLEVYTEQNKLAIDDSLAFIVPTTQYDILNIC